MNWLGRAAYLLQKNLNPGLYPPIQSQAFHQRLAGLWREFEEVLSELTNVYDVNPVLIGGVALQFYGLTRMTEDIDLLISRDDYQALDDKGLVKFGHLRWPGIQIDLVREGMDNNPNPDFIRSSQNNYLPSLEGLIYTKLIQNRMKDSADIVELIKLNFLDELKLKVLNFELMNDKLTDKFLDLWNIAEQEMKRT